MKKKLLFIFALLCAVAQGAWAQNVVDLSTLTEDYVARHNDVLTGRLAPSEERSVVKVSIDYGATVTLSNVYFGWYGVLSCKGNATIILAEGTTNSIKSHNNPGICVGPEGTTTTITSKSTNPGKLTIEVDEDDSVYPGIGGIGDCGNIIIENGIIETTGGSGQVSDDYLASQPYPTGSPGIGSSYGHKCGDITIKGGKVTATAGREGGSGIGTSDRGGCGTITISGGEVHATGNAGIGNGDDVKTGVNVRITGGTVYATGINGAAGIGGGFSYGAAEPVGKIEISGGVVYAYGGKGAAGIGGGNASPRDGSDGGTIVISGNAEVHATGGQYGAGIGGADGGSGGSITIEGGTIVAIGGEQAAGIGGGEGDTGGDIHITGGNVTATGGEYAAGIGGGNGGSGGTITINGGTIEAKGGAEAAGIGGGEDGTGGDIFIYDGDIKAYGGEYAAGIGGGDGDSGGTIKITGGTVKAYGGKDAAGIGGGEGGDSGSIVINGGNVYASGSGYGVGIGAGEDGDVDNTISINGGTVDAYGGLDIRRAIGGEDDEDYDHISIGDRVKVTDVSSGTAFSWIFKSWRSYYQDYIRLKFETCDHAGATYSIVNAEKHQCSCQWCGIFEEDHTAQTPCAKCGYTGKTLDLSTVQSNLTVYDGVTVTGTLNTASHPVKITIADGATVTLSGMNISGVNNSSYNWAGITCEGDATIILADGTTNTVKGFYEDYPGIYVPQNYSLTIKGETAGTGSLNASSNGFGAGIGGGYCGASCGVISINGGNITATGGKYCAGIGSSHNNSCSHILINGGTIHATGGENAAGIGSGWGGTNAGDFSSCGMINILSDVTSVTATKGAGAPNSIGAGYQGTCSVVAIGSKVGAVERSPYYYFPLANASSNSTKISAFNGEVCDVTLKGRTLYKDNSWNTLCLPFSISDFSGTPLAGATVKTLESTSFDSTNGALTLNFTEANLTAIEAGKPYIVKWASGDNIENPMFTNVTITATTPTDITPTGSGSDGSVTFKGTFGPHDIGGTDGDNTKLYLGNGNKLYWPSGAKSINAFRAYFQLNNGITAGNQPNSGVRAFVLNFDGDEETGIATTNYTDSTDSDNAWYDLSGRKLSGKPTTKGLYINNGKKVVIK